MKYLKNIVFRWVIYNYLIETGVQGYIQTSLMFDWRLQVVTSAPCQSKAQDLLLRIGVYTIAQKTEHGCNLVNPARQLYLNTKVEDKL